jgi:hypothetical protein
MFETLTDLETDRTNLLGQIAGLGDFRRGSITTTTGTCGTPSCHCHKPNAPGHGPNFRLTYKVQGKTVTESFSTPAGLRKAQREVAEYHRFRELSQQLLEVNEKICRARPVEATLTIQEKKRPKRSSKKSATK